MKIKATFAIAIFAVIMLSMTIFGNAQDYGQTKVVLHNDAYFLLPDSYVSTTDLFPVIEGVSQISKSYQNKHIAANAQFTSFKLSDNDKSLKEMGIENYMTDKMKNSLNIRIAKTIDMNGRDTFFLRGETKQDYIMQTSRFSNRAKTTTSESRVKLEVIMYIIKDGEYIYMSFYQTPTHYFPTNFRTFLEVQNSFTTK